MAMAAGGKKGIKADINVTPLVDVVLVLLIIFMVITPMLQRGKDVTLPIALKSKANAANNADPIILSITKDRKLFLEKDEFPTAEAISQAVKTTLDTNPSKAILLKGDQSLQVEDVRKLMLALQKSGAKGVKLGVEEKE